MNIGEKFLSRKKNVRESEWHIFAALVNKMKEFLTSHVTFKEFICRKSNIFKCSVMVHAPRVKL